MKFTIPFPNDNNATKGAYFSYSSSTPSVTKKAPKKKSDSDADNVPVSVSEEEEAKMESEDEEKDSKAAPAPSIEGEEPCVSPPADEEDNDNENDDDDDDDDDNDDNDDKEDTDVDEEKNIFDFNLNVVEGMSEYKVLCLQKIRRNEAKLASLSLLAPMTSASLSSDPSNSMKRSASQDDVERRVQPKRNAKQPTSYRDLDDPVISKRTCSINSSDIGEEDTGSKRMDKMEYIPSSGDDEEEEDDEDEQESYNDDELDRRFPQAKAEAAVEILTDVYGHSKTVSYCDTNDSDLQSDEDGDEASKKSTIRFSNSDSNGPEVFEAAVNNDDLKPPARHTVLPPPMPSLDDAEEEEEEEEVIPVNHPVNHPKDEETSLMMKAFTNKSSTSNVVLPNPALADELIFDINDQVQIQARLAQKYGRK